MAGCLTSSNPSRCSGNVTYGLSIILRVPSLDNKFYQSTLAYIIGSIGTMIFDVTILVQGWLYGYQQDDEEGLSAVPYEPISSTL